MSRATPTPDEPATADGAAWDRTARAAAEHGWLTRGVVSVGVASFGSDAGHEMTTSLLPTFLTSTLHAGPAALGAIEGVSDALVGLSKLAGGPLSSDPVRRGRLASGGYLVTAFATTAIGLAGAVWQVALLRALSWISRGLRSPARDTMLMSLVPRTAYGRASGVERAGDNAGALVGPLVAAALVGVRNCATCVDPSSPGVLLMGGRLSPRAGTRPLIRRGAGALHRHQPSPSTTASPPGQRTKYPRSPAGPARPTVGTLWKSALAETTGSLPTTAP